MLVQPHSASPQVAGAIRQAATSTGASFNYLLATAQIESNFNPAAQAATSTAKGLYQFIDQTWLGTMKAAGRALGLDRFAAAISRGENGRFEVQDATARQAIMNLRGDAKVSALLAGQNAQANAAQLKDGLGRAPTEGELYIAHFMGADGATRLIDAATHRPDTRGADLFPSAAQANRPIFYDRSGNARTALGVYRELTGRYETARANAGANIAATPLRGTLPVEAVARMSPPAPIPDTAGVAKAYASAQPVAFAPAPTPPCAFYSILSDTGLQGVAPSVRSMWSTAAAGAVQGPKPRSLVAD
jgi:hypothetical protein